MLFHCFVNLTVLIVVSVCDTMLTSDVLIHSTLPSALNFTCAMSMVNADSSSRVSRLVNSGGAAAAALKVSTICPRLCSSLPRDAPMTRRIGRHEFPELTYTRSPVRLIIKLCVWPRTTTPRGPGGYAYDNGPSSMIRVAASTSVASPMGSNKHKDPLLALSSW